MCLSVFCELCDVTVNHLYVKMNKLFAKIFLKDFFMYFAYLARAKYSVPILYFYKRARAKYSKNQQKSLVFKIKRSH